MLRRPIGESWWFCFASAVYAGGGIVLLEFVNRHLVVMNRISAEANTSFRTPQTPWSFLGNAVLANGRPDPAIFQWVHLVSVPVFLVFLFLPRLPWNKAPKEYVSLRRGTTAAATFFAAGILVLLTPAWDVLLILPLAFVSGLLLLFLVAWYAPMLPNSVALGPDRLREEAEVLKVEIDKWWHMATVLLPLVVAFIVGVLLAVGFSTPVEKDLLKSDYTVAQLVSSRGFAAFVSAGYVFIGMGALLANIGLRLYLCYYRLESLGKK